MRVQLLGFKELESKKDGKKFQIWCVAKIDVKDKVTHGYFTNEVFVNPSRYEARDGDLNKIFDFEYNEKGTLYSVTRKDIK